MGDNTVGFTASGLGYPPNMKIDVFLWLTGGEGRASTRPLAMTTIYTDGGGRWSVPTYTEIVNPAGNYGVDVNVHETTGGAIIGKAGSTCSF